MNAVQKTIQMAMDRNAGLISDTDIALQHQTIALEMFPQLPVGKALNAFFNTEIGKQALGAAAAAKHAELQKAYRIGDADIAIGKTEKDDAGDVQGGPKVRHAHPGKERRRKATPTPTDGNSYTADEGHDPNNRQLNGTPIALGKYCDSLASECAAQFGISKSEAYDRLLKTDRAFGIVWKAALALPAE